jgi:mono/diheme cytochrome c family protein
MRRRAAGIVSRLGPAAALVALGLSSWVRASQPPAATLAPPIDLADPVNIEAGRQMFNVTCTHYCHGMGARGGGMRGPSLRNRGFDNAYLYGRISGGRPPMPAFATIYTPEQIWKLIAYIQSLRD